MFPGIGSGLNKFQCQEYMAKKYASDFYTPTDLFPLVSSSPMASEVLNFFPSLCTSLFPLAGRFSVLQSIITYDYGSPFFKNPTVIFDSSNASTSAS